MKRAYVIALLGAASALALAGEALAQSAETATASELETVVVTGARSAARTVQNSPAPIDVLSGNSVVQANKPNLIETLNTLLPSYNLPNVATPNIGSLIRAGQLRGLNPDQTLVLVNGKRRHSTAFLGAGGFSASAPADLSLIASGAVERIEVLRDGASALYGSDAIAGVINIITKTQDHGGEVSVRAGQFYEGDGLTKQVRGDIGFKLGQGGHLHLSGQIDDQQIVIRNSEVNPNLLFYFPLNAQGKEVLPAGVLNTNPSLPAGATPNPKEATRDNHAWKNQGQAPFNLKAVAADFGLPLGGGAEFYAFGTYAHRTSAAPQNFRTPNRDEVVRAIYPDGFTPVETIDEDDFEISTGIRGELAGWGYDLSSGFGRDIVDVGVENSINPTYGLASQRDFYIGRLNYSAWTNNLDLRRSLTLGLPVDLSFGGEYRRETFALSPGDVQSYTNGGALILDGPNAGKAFGASLGGSQALPGYRPTDAVDVARDSYALYTGASLHLTKAWLVDLAGRYEHYSDFGSTTTGRLSTRYDFGKWLAVRGTISNGFHAPALAAQYYRNTGNANTSTNYVLQVNSPQARALGSQPLRPEKSTNYSIGFVSEPIHGVNLAVDLYQIDVKDRIAQSTTFREGLYPGSGALVVAAGLGPQDGVSYFINAADSRTKGIELTAETTTRTENLGTFHWTFAVNFNDAKVTRIAATPAVLARFNIPVFSAGSQNNLKYLSPRSKEVLSVNWTRGRFSTLLRETHYGAIRRFGTPTTVATSGPYAGLAEIPYNIGGLWVTDLDIGVALTERVNLTLSVNNLFSVKPSRLPAPLLAAYQIYSYANNGPISAAGGFYSATLKYRW